MNAAKVFAKIVFAKIEQSPHQKNAKRHIKISPNVTFTDKIIVL